MALFHKRNLQPVRMLQRPAPPPPLSRADLLAGTAARGLAEAPLEPEPDEREADERLKDEVFDRILRKYQLKLIDERKARLDGRIVEADFYVRQLTYLEVLLDLGGQGVAAHGALETLRGLTPDGMETVQAAATPISVLLDRVRRALWAEKGEPDRPPLGDLGEHDGKISTGPSSAYNSARDGDHEEWSRRQAEAAALAAQAQRAWEEKARAEAEVWRRSTESKANGA